MRVRVQLKKRGIIDSVDPLRKKGFSNDFARIMQACCVELMGTCAAKVGYTQSDEITVIIPPASIVRGQQQVHFRGGRVVKICTTAAAACTARFNSHIAKLCVQKQVPTEEMVEILAMCHFDCRLGHYNTWVAAQSILLWRAYDCSVNGVSDAVYQQDTQAYGGKRKTIAKHTKDKLLLLKEMGCLPLPMHQSQGSYYCRVRRVKDGWNPQKKEAVKSLRSTVELVEQHVLQLSRCDALLLLDDAPIS